MEAKDRRPENPCKRYVKVRADFELDGRIRPLLFREEDGPAFRIDRVLDVRQAASRKAGGQGIRYVCFGSKPWKRSRHSPWRTRK